jgi:hypothetical protein
MNAHHVNHLGSRLWKRGIIPGYITLSHAEPGLDGFGTCINVGHVGLVGPGVIVCCTVLSFHNVITCSVKFTCRYWYLATPADAVGRTESESSWS